MRHFLPVLLSIFILQASGQSFTTYKDTLNHFSINIPTGWKYGVNKKFPDLKFLAYRIPLNQSDTSRDNYNINIIGTPTKNLEETFSDFLKYLNAEKLQFIDQGDTILNGTKFKWLIETHKNGNNGVQMHNYDFVAIKHGKTYILTMVTFSYAFGMVKPLFDKIASSFILLN